MRPSRGAASGAGTLKTPLDRDPPGRGIDSSGWRPRARLESGSFLSSAPGQGSKGWLSEWEAFTRVLSCRLNPVS